MNPEDFVSNRAGSIIRNEFGEWAFLPNPLPAKINFTPELVRCLSQTERSLGAWSGLCRFPGLFEIDLYTGPMIRLEAALSSRIEGTRTTLREVLLLEAAPGNSFSEDARLVKNLSDAILSGWKHIRGTNVDIGFLCGLHKRLLRGVRGEAIEPGLLREEQVYVRSGVQTIAEADFVPPPAEKVLPLLQQLTTYLADTSEIPDLLRIGLAHYQFEVIHPFMDGNGRVGRLLITLLMAKWGLLPVPVLNLSKYFLSHRSEYARSLLRVSQLGLFEEWLHFFLKGVNEQSNVSVNTIRRLGELRAQWNREIVRPRMPARLPDLINFLFRKPILTIQEASTGLKITFSEARRLIQELVDKGILSEQTGRKRDRIFEAEKILDILTTLERI